MTKALLLMASLSFLWVCCGPINAEGKRLEPMVGALPRDAIGYGDTEEQAKAAALNVAFKLVKELMAAQKPPLDACPLTEKDVRAFVETGHKGDKFEDAAVKGPLKQWVLPFRTDADWWRELVRKDREARADQRQTWTAGALLGLTMVLLAAVGYVRLDEYTQRRYTAWLRFAGLGLAACSAAGLWYAFHGG